jgi:hypothetical protein
MQSVDYHLRVSLSCGIGGRRIFQKQATCGRHEKRAKRLMPGLENDGVDS